MLSFLWKHRNLPRRSYSTIRQVLAQSPERISVLYGTHSGNCQRYAQHFTAELRSRFNINAPINNIADVEFSGIEHLEPNDTLILLVSTYGDGEPNKATSPFWNYVKRLNNERTSLRFSYSVLSRGSSLFENTFAWAGIKLDKQLMGCGARQLTPTGIQDKISPNSFDEYFDWKESVFTALKSHKGLTERPLKYEPSINVEEIEPQQSIKPSPIYHRLDYDAKVVDVKAKRLQATDRQYVSAYLNVSNYQCGDYVVIWPRNPEYQVKKFLHAIFGNDPRSKNLLKTDKVTTSYELIARHLIDVNGQPERDLLLKLQTMAPSNDAVQNIRKLLRVRNQPLPSLADLLTIVSQGTPWIKSLPPSAFFDVLPALEPRKYSISSSPKSSPDWAELTCVVEHENGSDFWGVATSELLQFTDSKSEKIMAAVEHLPSFRLPNDSTSPLLLFGVGTGVAPFCGFIRERVAQSKEQHVGPTILFTGTRTRDDLIHHQELELYSADKSANFELIPSYSRANPLDPNRGYIAEAMKKHDELIWTHLLRGAHIYICGDIRKVRSHVRNAILDIMASKLNLPSDQRKPLWKSLKREGRLHLELW